MKVAVVGTGYVGLVAGAGFAEFGNDVRCVDVDAARIARLQAGEIPIHEPGLETLVQRTVSRGRLAFTTDLKEALRDVEVVFLAVGTPSLPSGACDTTQLEATAKAVGKALTGFAVVAIKSTVPVGTAERVAKMLAEAGARDVAVAANPEFLTEGNAVADFMKPARIIVGTQDERAQNALRAIYAPFVRTIDRILMMDTRSAELCKYACNAFLATRISFMNELSRFCDRVGADVEKVRVGMAWDERIGARYLFPGVGFGGSCLPKDIRALAAMAREIGSPLGVIEAVDAANTEQRRYFAKKIWQRLGGAVRGKSVAVWGLSFKPNTDDIREAPSIDLVEQLRKDGAQVRAHDPVAMSVFAHAVPDGVQYCDDPYDCVAQADALVLLTEWHAFRRPDFARIRSLMRSHNIFDGRNIWDPAELRALGFYYEGVGRPAAAV